ncbi:hypothetical protein AM233_22590 [Bacillus sp. FJAT-22058]|nr:hypothetical protein AM233_22590 [Bacillus sp. FJAT-22058]
MERKARDSCGKSESMGDPAGAKAPRRLPDHPRKASAWSGNQRPRSTNKKTAGNMEVYLNTKTKLIGTEGTRLLREKRVPGVEINGRVLQTKKLQANSFFLEFVCSQSGRLEWSNPKP